MNSSVLPELWQKLQERNPLLATMLANSQNILGAMQQQQRQPKQPFPFF